MKTTLIPPSRVHCFVNNALGSDLHAKRVLSLGNAVIGTLAAAALAIHAIGLGLAKAGRRQPKHAVKQVDRLLSNQGIDVWGLFEQWVPFVIGSRSHVVLTLDWTEFDADDRTPPVEQRATLRKSWPRTDGGASTDGLPGMRRSMTFGACCGCKSSRDTKDGNRATKA